VHEKTTFALDRPKYDQYGTWENGCYVPDVAMVI